MILLLYLRADPAYEQATLWKSLKLDAVIDLPYLSRALSNNHVPPLVGYTPSVFFGTLMSPHLTRVDPSDAFAAEE